MMELPRLFPGARVALVGPSSAVRAELLPPALEAVRALGLAPVPYPSCFDANRRGYLAATDAQRAADLNAAFRDGSIDGIWCIRGGCGAARVLPLLDLHMICAHPKWFGGYSDITALHTVLNQDCHMPTYHVTMPSSWSERPLDPFSLAYVRRALDGTLRGPLPVCRPPDPLRGGRASGPLCGGNLSLIAASLGTPWALNAKGKILFLEDVGEYIYRVDGMLTQLRGAGLFDDCAGVLLGDFTDVKPADPERSLTLRQLFRELILPAGKPVLSGLPCGHGLPTMALPLGARLTMDADACALEVTL